MLIDVGSFGETFLEDDAFYATNRPMNEPGITKFMLLGRDGISGHVGRGMLI